jgi:hypothetical protein
MMIAVAQRERFMTHERRMTRWRAASIHLGLSAAIGTLVVLGMYLLWYPPPYFDLMGGPMLVVLIVGCDVVIGPLITLIIFRSGKRGLKFDLVCITMAQLAALSYGLYTMFDARPVFTVFAVDRFEIVSASDIDSSNLAQASVREFASLPVTGPRVVGAKLPTDPAEHDKVLFFKYGADLKGLPKFYVPYDQVAADAAHKAKPLDTLESKGAATREAVERTVSRLGVPHDNLGYLPLVGHFADMAAIVDLGTGHMLAVVDANPW